MPSSAIIQKAIDQEFTQRVAFCALRAAQNVASESPDTPNHEARVMYADRVFRGEDKVALLTLHVVAASPTIEAALQDGDASDVEDSDIDAALGAIWDARANAFGGMVVDKASFTLQALNKIKIEVQNMAEEVRTAQQTVLAQVTTAATPNE